MKLIWISNFWKFLFHISQIIPYHNNTTNVNHVSSLLDRTLSINANIIQLTNEANNSTYLQLNSTGGTFAGDVKLSTAGKKIIADFSSGGTTRKTELELYNSSDGGFTLNNEHSSTGGIKFQIDGNDALSIAKSDKSATFAGAVNVFPSSLGGSTAMSDGTLIFGAGSTSYYSFRLDSNADLHLDKVLVEQMLPYLV